MTDVHCDFVPLQRGEFEAAYVDAELAPFLHRTWDRLKQILDTRDKKQHVEYIELSVEPVLHLQFYFNEWCTALSTKINAEAVGWRWACATTHKTVMETCARTHELDYVTLWVLRIEPNNTK